MSELERMLSGKLYRSSDEELIAMSHRCRQLLDEFNATKYSDFATRRQLLSRLFGRVGSEAIVNKPFHCDYGQNIQVGDYFYANYDCIFLDVNKITIGNNVMLAPKVSIYTAGHPIDKDVRNEGLEYGYPVTIGDDVWIGGNVVINPGVNIGNNVVIGSGSVVTKDIPSNCVACGIPCRPIRSITEEDKRFWERQKAEYLASIEEDKLK